jgi:quercetin dioxygenase-like cupin family protein
MTDISRQHLLTAEVMGHLDRVEAHQVRLSPGQQLGCHVHPGGVFGCVVDGGISLQIEGQPASEFRAGSVFYEPPGARIGRVDNLSSSEPATFVAYYPLTGDQPLIEFV